MQQSREDLLVRIAGQILLGGLAFRRVVDNLEALVHAVSVQSRDAVLELAVGPVLLDDVGRSNSKFVRRR